MMYKAKFHIMAGWVPQLLRDWLEESLPVDLTVKPGRWKGVRTIVVTIEATDAESLHAKREAFNAMIEAKGYGPEANKK